MTRLSISMLASLTALTTFAISPAMADDLDGTDRDTERTGATFGVGVGGGHIGCSTDDGDDCDGDGANEAAGLDLHAGLMVTPRLALMGELWGMTHRDDRLTVSQGIAAAVARGWVAPRVYLQGGLGVARASATLETGIGDLMSETDYVPAAVAGIGVEAISAPNFALDVTLKAGSGLYEDEISIYNVALGVGVNFY